MYPVYGFEVLWKPYYHNCRRKFKFSELETNQKAKRLRKSMKQVGVWNK